MQFSNEEIYKIFTDSFEAEFGFSLDDAAATPELEQCLVVTNAQREAVRINGAFGQSGNTARKGPGAESLGESVNPSQYYAC